MVASGWFVWVCRCVWLLMISRFGIAGCLVGFVAGFDGFVWFLTGFAAGCSK